MTTHSPNPVQQNASRKLVSRCSSQARRDLVILSLVAVAAFILCYFGDAWERFSAFVANVSAWDSMHLHELMIVALLSPFAAAVFAFRRLRELNALLREREGHVRLLEAAQATIAEQTAILHDQAFKDPLTGLANRNALFARLESLLAPTAAADRGVCAVAYFGLDNFKRVNDHFGHAAGNALLQDVAERITHQLRENDTLVCRAGGDHFVVVLQALRHPFDAEVIAARTLEQLARPFQFAGAVIATGASAGITLLESGPQDPGEALHNAETAMYEAKRLGRGRFVVFDPVVRERLERRARLARDLPLAIERGELGLAYQPIVSLSTGAINGVEGLLRWRHAELGPISPGEFIPLAEESDVILEIGEWVLREGCRQMADWLERFPASAPPLMSLNVSRKQFSQPDLSERIGRAIRGHGVPAERIQVEITEDSYVGDTAAAMRIMRDIKAQGVKLAIDDFGVGSSTLAAVQQFPIDVLKVDRSLVTDAASSPDSAAIVHSLAVLVRNLNVKLVAEGIEDPEQVIALQELGCQYGQGFLFGRPMSPTEIEEEFAGTSLGVTASGASAFGNLWQHRLAAFQRLELEETGQTTQYQPEAPARGN